MCELRRRRAPTVRADGIPLCCTTMRAGGAPLYCAPRAADEGRRSRVGLRLFLVRARGIVAMAAIDWLYSKLIGGFTSHWLSATWPYGGTSVNWLGEHVVLAPNLLTKDAINLFMHDFGASWAGNRRDKLLRVSRSYGQSCKITSALSSSLSTGGIVTVEKQWSFENCTCNT